MKGLHAGLAVFLALLCVAAVTVNPPNVSKVTGILSVPNGGTGTASGTSGGVLGYTAATTIASSVALSANQIVLGGGAGATPIPLGSLGTTTTLLHGNAAGAPTFGAVSLTADVSGVLPLANGGTSSNAWTTNGVLFASASTTLSNGTNVWWDGQSFAVGRGSGGAAMRDSDGGVDSVQDFAFWDTASQGGNIAAQLTSGAIEFNFGMRNASGNNVRRALIALADISNTAGSETGGLLFGTRATGGIATPWSMRAATGDFEGTSANLSLLTAGKGIKIKEGSNARMGTAVLDGGSPASVVVANTSVTASTRVIYCRAAAGGTLGHLSQTQIAATSFTITSSANGETSTITWLLVEPSP